MPSSRSRQRKALGAKAEASSPKKMAKYLQYKYRLAILSNIPDLEAMRKAVFATLFHLMSTDEFPPHHNRCPTGQDSWCFFNKAIARNEEPAPHAQEIQRPLKHEVAEQLVPVYRGWLIPIF